MANEKLRAQKLEWYHKNKEKEQKRAREYQQTEKGKYSRYQSSAKVRNIYFDLSFEKFMEYWKAPCEYCGSEINTIGIDRIDNSQGYVEGNIKACCEICNTMKMTMDEDDWYEQMIKILNHQKLIGQNR